MDHFGRDTMSNWLWLTANQTDPYLLIWKLNWNGTKKRSREDDVVLWFKSPLPELIGAKMCRIEQAELVQIKKCLKYYQETPVQASPFVLEHYSSWIFHKLAEHNNKPTNHVVCWIRNMCVACPKMFFVAVNGPDNESIIIICLLHFLLHSHILWVCEWKVFFLEAPYIFNEGNSVLVSRWLSIEQHWQHDIRFRIQRKNSKTQFLRVIEWIESCASYYLRSTLFLVHPTKIQSTLGTQ